MKEKKNKAAKNSSSGLNADINVLGMYLREISRIPLLTREEEEHNAREAAKGNMAARNKLINGNLRFVVNVAKRYQGQGIPLADLISEGNIGLINAVERFDAERGYHFISYAVWWIRQSILKALCEKSRLIRLPANRASELIQIEKAKKLIAHDINSESEIHEIARLLSMDENHVEEMILISKEMVSLENVINPVNGNSQLGSFIEDTRYKAPEHEAIQKSLEKDINEMLNSLDSKEAEIIRCRYGLGRKTPMSLNEIGKHFDLTKERIRQIEQKAMVRLQHPNRKMKLEAYVA